MSGNANDQLVRQFLVRAVAAAGGVAEESGAGLEVLLSERAARKWGVAEHVWVRLGPGDAPAGQASVDGRIGSALLDGLVAERVALPALAALALPPELPVPLRESVPTLLNAVRSGADLPVRAGSRYLTLDLRLTLQGEELRSTLVPLTLRLADGARVPSFSTAGAYAVQAPPLDEAERDAVHRALSLWLRREGPSLHAIALETVRRRTRRDLERLADYFTGLDADMEKSAGRARSDTERARRAEKRAALPAELAARREQIRGRAAARLSATLVAATLIHAEVECVTIRVRRRSRDGAVRILSRLAGGIAEGPACAACGAATLRFFLCDGPLHVLCDACGKEGKLDAARCPACRAEAPPACVLRVEDRTTQIFPPATP